MDAVYLFFEKENIKIPFYNFDKELFNQLIKSKMGYWEQTEKQYCISRSGYDQEQMKVILGGKPFVEVGKEAENQVKIHGFISGGQSFEETETAAETEPETYPTPKIYPGMKKDADKLPNQFPEYWREKLEVEMRAIDFSRHTRIAYTKCNAALCKWLQKKPEEVTTDDIKRYLAFLEKHKDYAASTLNSTLSALKFFYGFVLKRDIAKDQRRPRQDKRMPVVLSRNEVKKILESEKNMKHRLLLMMVYASGLRVSEAVNLKKNNIDIELKKINVISGKGRKDRKTCLSDMVLEMIEEYFKLYKITNWVFPGANPNEHLSIRTAQHICEHAVKKAGLEKKASIHSLRHTFATHLLENGYDICKIKELLGHSSVITTERYTKVANLKSSRVKSPLDMLDEPDPTED